MDRTAYDRYFALETRHFWKRARRALVQDLVETYRPQQAEPLRLLDVGGGPTLVALELARFGEVMVVEPDAPTVELMRGRGVNIVQGSLPDDLPPGPFDVVTCLDVLEHVDDDRGAARALRGLVRPGGLFLCTVPAYPWLWSEHDVAVHHKRRYTRAGFEATLRDAGFQIRRLTFHTGLLLPVLVAKRVAERARKPNPAPEYDTKVPPAPVNAAFGLVMGLEGRLIHRGVNLPWGSTLVGVCG